MKRIEEYKNLLLVRTRNAYGQEYEYRLVSIWDADDVYVPATDDEEERIKDNGIDEDLTLEGYEIMYPDNKRLNHCERRWIGVSPGTKDCYYYDEKPPNWVGYVADISVKDALNRHGIDWIGLIDWYYYPDLGNHSGGVLEVWYEEPHVLFEESGTPVEEYRRDVHGVIEDVELPYSEDEDGIDISQQEEVPEDI